LVLSAAPSNLGGGDGVGGLARLESDAGFAAVLQSVGRVFVMLP